MAHPLNPTYQPGQRVIVATANYGDQPATVYDDRGDTVRVKFNPRTSNVFVYPKTAVRPVLSDERGPMGEEPLTEHERDMAARARHGGAS